MYAVVCNLIVSHLQAGAWQRVIVIQSLNPFPWEMLQQHPEFEEEWLNAGRIESYSLSSFPELFSFFCLDFIRSTRAGSVLAFITNFHELIEHYRLQISKSYEELLLKHQIDKNRQFLDNIEKFEQEGPTLISLPFLPKDSALLKQHPIIKAQNHITELFKMIGEFTYRYSALSIFLGHLEPQYKLFAKKRTTHLLDPAQSQATLSQSSGLSYSSTNDRRLVLMPVTFGNQNASDERQSFDLNESKLAARLIFYNDWLYNSPMFLSRKRAALPKEHYQVPVVKFSNLNSVSNIHEPIFFDFQHNYDIENADGIENFLIDLLAEPDNDISQLIQESLQSTQTMPRAISTQLSMLPSSSPNSKTRPDSVETVNDMKSQNFDVCESQLVIDGSDVELTGTLLDDLDKFHDLHD